MAKADLTAARLRELLHYDPETGVFTRKKSVCNAAEGKIAGSRHSEGYLEITIDYKKYYAHRLAWMYINGVMPNGMIDHVDGVRSNNRISNLRTVDFYGNSHNVRKKSSGGTSSYLGVCFDKGTSRWKAQIRAFGKYMYLGLFDSEEEAHAAYLRGKKQMHIPTP